MLRPEPGSLREALAASPRTGGHLYGASAETPFSALLDHSPLGGARDALRGRAVMIATADQFTAALALIDLDGVARRLLLCPPDLDPAHWPALLDRAEIDAVVSDLAPGDRPDV